MRSIHVILSSFPEVKTAVLFGSRAMGNYKEASDIDIALLGKEINFKVLINLKDQFENSNIPYFVDLVDYQTIASEALLKHINDVGITIYSVPR
ncbi:nucleotidyltransferase domain-containing protein [Cysteiniphilum sp. 6C5]|uniref:nucleotidyltransferase domain-containing protein n=1 Tax=unclassified Cysteiniphilum TaxID=2610889 RepID=UPI003F87C133